MNLARDSAARSLEGGTGGSEAGTGEAGNFQPTIGLSATAGLDLLLPVPSGVTCLAQTGGLACLQSRLVGVYVPLASSEVPQEDLLRAYFTGPKWPGACANGIDAGTADILDGILACSPATRFLIVDRSRLGESHEAWIWVQPADAPPLHLGIVEGFADVRGVLTWRNSD